MWVIWGRDEDARLSHVYDGRGSSDIGYFQMCDIADEDVRLLLNNARSVRKTFDVSRESPHLSHLFPHIYFNCRI
jgi:hypothetical protein